MCEGVEYDPDSLVESTIAAGKMEAEKTGFVMFQKTIDLRNVSGRIFVHARVIAESLGCSVEWDGNTRTVIINSENAVIVSEQSGNLPPRVALDRSGIAEAKLAKYKATEDELVRLVNEARLNRGLSSLEQDEKLTKAARIQAKYMADNQNENCTDSEIQKIVNENFGQITWINVAKNIGGKTTGEIMKSLTNIYSSKNTKIGIGGAVDKNGKLYWICISVKPFDDAEKTRLEDEVLRLINEERTKNGLNPVVKNDGLAEVARMKAQDNVDNNNRTHKSIKYGYPDEMLKNIIGISANVGENLADGATPYDIFNSWMNSEAHKKNILNPKGKETGIGIALMENGLLYCSFMIMWKY